MVIYEIKYLPVAIKDLKEIVDYITIILCNKKAALDFIDALDHSVSRLHSFPYSCRLYKSQSLLNAGCEVDHSINLLQLYQSIDFMITLCNL